MNEDKISKEILKFIQGDIQTIVFARSRTEVEILLQYLKDSYGEKFQKDKRENRRNYKW